MDSEAETLAQAIGARVRQERQRRRWTLDVLAAEAGVSRRMVVNVEQGVVNPSIGTLLRLSDALGVGLPSLVQSVPTPSRGAANATPAGGGAVLWSGERGGRAVLVAGTEPPDVVELWDWTLQPGELHESEAHTAGTRELLQVLGGAIVVEVDGVDYELGTGDALAFDGDVDHSYANRGDEAARFSLAVFEPGVGAAHRTEHADA